MHTLKHAHSNVCIVHLSYKSLGLSTACAATIHAVGTPLWEVVIGYVLYYAVVDHVCISVCYSTICSMSSKYT